ncbi:uncharacterized protein [Typha angustifolia]|uniref:uncharacterized protein n=1 Tax=Typha angustifolia TaxID=59011 RepID=UPI003C2E7566
MQNSCEGEGRGRGRGISSLYGRTEIGEGSEVGVGGGEDCRCDGRGGAHNDRHGDDHIGDKKDMGDEKEKSMIKEGGDEKKGVAEGKERGVADDATAGATSSTRKTYEKIGKQKDFPKRKLKNEEEQEEDNKMTLSEYERMLKERKKSLEVLKREERKVVEDQFHGMLPIQRKKEDGYSVKLSSETSKQKEENVRKSISINQFLKPKEDEDVVKPLPTFGRGAIPRGGLRANSSGRGRAASVPNFDDAIHFPALKAMDKA